MPPRTRRTTHQPEQTQAATTDQPQPEQDQAPAARDAEPAEQDGLTPPDGMPAERADDLPTTIAAEPTPEPAAPRVTCPECTPAGGLPADATAFACIHGSWDLT